MNDNDAERKGMSIDEHNPHGVMSTTELVEAARDLWINLHDELPLEAPTNVVEALDFARVLKDHSDSMLKAVLQERMS
jgi:hypothetical protein